jgi:hypothetical protein
MADLKSIPMVRVKADTEQSFVLINCKDFDHDVHELHDKKDKGLIPPRPEKVEVAEAADIDDLRKQLGRALDRAAEAESERDEMKSRAEAAEKALSEAGKAKAGK